MPPKRKTLASAKLDAMMARKVDFRQLKEPGTFPDLYEKLALELALILLQGYFNAHGFEATLGHMLELRTRNDLRKA
jgi:hypothetical protein